MIKDKILSAIARFEDKGMESQDRRIKRTQQLLAKALIVLTLEKGYEAVTIRDLTERADVGYATFFRHYQSKDALLRDVSDVVLADLKSLLPGSPSVDVEAVGVPLFHYVQEHANIIHVLLRSRGTSSLVQHIIEITSQDVLKENKPLEGSIVPVEIGAYHLINSSISLIQWWLEHDMPYPPERMGAIFHALIIQPTRAVTFNPITQENSTRIMQP
ncbi:MAG: TetR/AcrR family transcriptional regulator [Ktedonobacteraceae bacterium]